MRQEDEVMSMIQSKVLKRKRLLIYFRNSLSIAMMQGLIDNISNKQNDNDLRVIVIEGEGPIFSAGHNLKELVRKNLTRYFDLI